MNNWTISIFAFCMFSYVCAFPQLIIRGTTVNGIELDSIYDLSKVSNILFNIPFKKKSSTIKFYKEYDNLKPVKKKYFFIEGKANSFFSFLTSSNDSLNMKRVLFGAIGNSNKIIIVKDSTTMFKLAFKNYSLDSLKRMGCSELSFTEEMSDYFLNIKKENYSFWKADIYGQSYRFLFREFNKEFFLVKVGVY